MSSTDVQDRVERYSMLIEWSNEDDAYIATVPELPGCRTHGATYAEAAKQGQDVIATWIEGALADGDPLPAPRLFARAHAGSSI